ncbi:UDP-N-acetylglucosamine diphosphorylase/glucosamine-1-phosphate N-acetyltransferase [Anaerolineae bacterium CFX7]|nr:UDP-N-acetylglucosamine diphosphorylase/glucosamine-1-phosphate N-acetyltransferase [Anaerolineae bacterium CFX7]
MSTENSPTSIPDFESVAAVILAAGQGTRMKSKLAKVLHPVAGKAMVEYSVASAAAAGARHTVLVIGYQGAQVRHALGERVWFAEQAVPRGTGDAVKCAAPILANQAAHVLVFYADMPLLKAETLRALIEKHLQAQATLTMLTLRAADPRGFGRIVRDANAKPVRIVEEVEATPQELALRELNPGVYCFNAAWLWQNIARLEPSPKKGEYYLTDLLAMAVAQRVQVETETITDEAQAIGINTRAHLAQAERVMRERIRERVMAEGVTLRDPATIYIDADVEIGPDTVILPNTHLQGKTRVGSDCRIGPNAILRDTIVGDACVIGPSLLEEATLQDHVDIGPFCHLRPHAHLAKHVHLGNYAEVKNSYLDEGVHMGHFSYMGDAQVGAHTNIAAGTITCNYDGKQKHRTVIGENVFIGSDSMLVAPLTIGDNARTGAGAVVTKDVPPNTLAVGVPARVIRKLNVE